MDELEFRRRIMSDPKQRDSQINEAIKADSKNAKFADDILELDTLIANAMKVDVPDGLADRILFNQSAAIKEDNVVRPTFVKRAMAMAASVAFVAGLLVGQVNWGNLVVSPANANLADTAIQHVFDEKGFVFVLDEQVQSSQINAKMVPFKKHLIEQFPYHVYYLNHCGFGDANAVHMVFKGTQGKVTLFLTGIASENAFTFEKQGMAGIVEPIGNNSLILVGDKGEDVANIAQTLMDIIKPMS